MANVPMVDATFDGIASSSEYNNVTANIRDHETRLTSTASTVSTHTSQISTLQANKLLVRAVYPTQNTNLTATGISAETDVTKLSATFNTVSGRRYRFDYSLNTVMTTGTDIFEGRMRLTTALTGTLIGQAQYGVPVVNAGIKTVLSMYYTAPSSASITVKFSIIRLAGAGTGYIYQDAAYRNFVEIYDTGVPGAGIVLDVA